MAAHRLDAILAGIFLVVSASATMGLTFAVRHMTDKGLASQSATLIDGSFLALAAVAGVLALSTAAAGSISSPSLGERVVADLRAALYGHVMTLDQASTS